MKKYYLLILFVLPYGINAQSVDQYVIGTAGSHAANGNLSLSWTIGEVVIEIFEKPFATVTQGLHQSQLTIITITVNPIRCQNTKMPRRCRGYFLTLR